MNLEDLMKTVATEVPMTKAQAKYITKAVFKSILVSLGRNEPVNIKDLGSLRPLSNGKVRVSTSSRELELPPNNNDPFLEKHIEILLLDRLHQKLRGHSTAPFEFIGRSSTRLWSARSKVAADFISPGMIVGDIGCGGMSLEKFLPNGCQYVPFDFFKRDARTVIIDLNDLDPELCDGLDVVVLLGVIEYVDDIESVLNYFIQKTSNMIISLNTKQSAHPLLVELGLSSMRPTLDQLEDTFSQVGWRILNLSETTSDKIWHLTSE